MTNKLDISANTRFFHDFPDFPIFFMLVQVISFVRFRRSLSLPRQHLTRDHARGTMWRREHGTHAQRAQWLVYLHAQTNAMRETSLVSPQSWRPWLVPGVGSQEWPSPGVPQSQSASSAEGGRADRKTGTSRGISCRLSGLRAIAIC